MFVDLYAVTVASVPFLLLALVADSSPIFGPALGAGQAAGIGRRLDAFADGFCLLMLLLAFLSGLAGLALHDPPDLRLPAAGGLALGALGLFGHAVGRVARLYRNAPPSA